MTERADDRLRPLGLTPKLDDYIGVYTQQLEASGKRTATVEKEKAYLKRWSAKIGHIRLNKIRPHHLSRVLTELAGEDYAARSVNLYLISIRHVLKAALRDGHIKPPLPYEGLGWQRVEKRAKLLPNKLQKFGFHDLRHHFISYAVMSGLDFMTIVRWVGHKDGGILIGKVYGHLADEGTRKCKAHRLEEHNQTQKLLGGKEINLKLEELPPDFVMHDHLRLTLPREANRLLKLQSERRFCHAMIVGFGILCIVNLVMSLGDRTASRGPIEVCMTTVVVALWFRSFRLQEYFINGFCIAWFSLVSSGRLFQPPASD